MLSSLLHIVTVHPIVLSLVNHFQSLHLLKLLHVLLFIAILGTYILFDGFKFGLDQQPSVPVFYRSLLYDHCLWVAF
jgi:hypothetical protein